jgi:hypothetical protein
LKGTLGQIARRCLGTSYAKFADEVVADVGIESNLSAVVGNFHNLICFLAACWEELKHVLQAVGLSFVGGSTGCVRIP